MRSYQILLAISVSILFFNPHGACAQWKQDSAFSGEVTSLASSGPNLLVGSDSGVSVSNDGGLSFLQRNSGLPVTQNDFFILDFLEYGRYLFASMEDHIFRSTDLGVSWTEADQGLKDYTNALTAFIPSGSNIFVSDGGGGIYSTADSGATWSQLQGWTEDDQLYAFAADNTYMYAGGGHGAYRSPDNGSTWAVISTGLNNNEVTCLMTNGQKLYAGTGYGVYISTDSGTKWTQSTGVPSTEIGGFAVIGQNIFAATYQGVFLSTNDGATWTEENTGLSTPGQTITNIAQLTISDNFLFAGVQFTEGSVPQLWRRPLSDFGIAGVVQATSPTIDISPNPTTNLISVRGAPPESRVIVMNMLGQTVLEIANEQLPDFTLDLSHLAPGAYCIRLVSPDACVTRMVLRG